MYTVEEVRRVSIYPSIHPSVSSACFILWREAGGLQPFAADIKREVGFTLDRSPVDHRAKMQHCCKSTTLCSKTLEIFIQNKIFYSKLQVKHQIQDEAAFQSKQSKMDPPQPVSTSVTGFKRSQFYLKMHRNWTSMNSQLSLTHTLLLFQSPCHFSKQFRLSETGPSLTAHHMWTLLKHHVKRSWWLSSFNLHDKCCEGSYFSPSIESCSNF